MKRNTTNVETRHEPERQHVAMSTVQAVEYLIRQNDRAKLRAFLAKLTPAERLAIKRQLEKESA